MPQQFRYARSDMDPAIRNSATVVAHELASEPDADGFPDKQSWDFVPSIRFRSDWQGQNEDAARETEVRLSWRQEMLWLRFRCRYRTITVFADSDPDGRREQLWDRDVAEVFIQTEPGPGRSYAEFEISPNGMWIDLEISPAGKRNLESGMKSRVVIDEMEKLWFAEVALPMPSLTRAFDPSSEWRVNFFRVEGASEPRFYSSWQATHTAKPNFHIPEAFGFLRFQKARSRASDARRSP